MSSATVVIEGRERSGALITARYAKDQGRTVYALPGSVGTKNAEVTNLLIKNGARLVTCADDIVADFLIGEGDRKLNPFKLASSTPVKMFDVLKELRICCVTPSDDIFRPSVAGKKNSKVKKEEQLTPPVSADEVQRKESEAQMQFDKKLLKIYKKIPIDKECTTDELVDGEFTMLPLQNDVSRTRH